MTRALGVALSLLMLARGASADVIQADRPGEADPPTVVPPGTIQIEGGFKVGRETGDDEDPDTDSYTLPDVTLRIGLLPKLELRIDADGFVYQDRGGAPNRANGSDLALGVKIHLLEQDGLLPGVGTNLGLSFPTGGSGVTSDGFDPLVQALFQWNVAERWDLVANLDFGAPTQGADDHRRVFRLEPELSLGLGLTPRWGTYVEYFGAIETGAEADEHSLDGGFTWLASDDLQLDLSAGGGLNDAAPEWFVSAGLSWRFRAWGE